jgi:hypothetical protein
MPGKVQRQDEEITTVFEYPSADAKEFHGIRQTSYS